MLAIEDLLKKRREGIERSVHDLSEKYRNLHLREVNYPSELLALQGKIINVTGKDVREAFYIGKDVREAFYKNNNKIRREQERKFLDLQLHSVSEAFNELEKNERQYYETHPGDVTLFNKRRDATERRLIREQHDGNKTHEMERQLLTEEREFDTTGRIAYNLEFGKDDYADELYRRLSAIERYNINH